MMLAHILGSSADSDIDIAAPLLTATEDAVPLANGYNMKTASKSTVKINSHLHPHPQRAVLSQICCFREGGGEVRCSPILLGGAESRDVRMP